MIRLDLQGHRLINLYFHSIELKFSRQAMYQIEKRKELAHEEAIWAADWFQPEPGAEGVNRIVTGGLDDTVKVWSYEKGNLNLEKNLLGHNLGVLSVSIDPKGKFLASSSLDSNISIWDLETYEQKRKIESGPFECWTVQFTRDSQFILTGSADGKVEVFSVETGKKEKSLETKQKMSLSLATSPDGKWIACGSTNGLVSLLDGATGAHFKTLEGHAMPVRALAFSPDSKLLLTASDDKHVKIYAISDFQVVGTMSGHSSWVLGVAFSPDGTSFATCSSDKSVRIWELSTKSCSHMFTDAHTDQVWSVVWGSDTKLCSVSEDRAINIYSIIK